MMCRLLADEYGLPAMDAWASSEIVTGSRLTSQLPLSRACAALGLARAAVYRWQPAELTAASIAEMELRHAMQEVALDMPSYGYRRIHASLLRLGFNINHKRVLRLMHQDNLLCLRRKKFVRTTDSQHNLPVFGNLVPDLEVTGINQLWVADITYVRLLHEFVFLAVVLDVYSRRCIGWAMAHHLRAELAVQALKMALGTRRLGAELPGLVHHSDRGTQYASRDYTRLLTDHGIRISMSRPGNPYDNAFAESFIKTLKYEEVHLWEYESMKQAMSRISLFIEQVYNTKRLHSALGYCTPVEFEQAHIIAGGTASA